MRTVLAVTAAGAALLLGTSGCTTAGYSATRIDPLPPGTKGRASGTAAWFEIERLKVALYGGDTAKEGTAVPPLRLRLVFDPPEIGYSFDPGQVLLRGASGTEWRPHVLGPGLVDQGGGGPCRVVGSAADAFGGSAYRFLTARTCFELGFDLTVQPDVPLDLVLDGFARGPKRLPSLTLRVQRRSWRSIEHIWPLEILLAPLAIQ
jgi:hypothetical protein